MNEKYFINSFYGLINNNARVFIMDYPSRILPYDNDISDAITNHGMDAIREMMSKFNGKIVVNDKVWNEPEVKPKKIIQFIRK